MGTTTDEVATYLTQIGSTPLLDAAEEVALAKRIEAGLLAGDRLATHPLLDPELAAELRWLVHDGQRAKDHLITANLRLVVSVAKHFTRRGLPLADLIQEGNLGLIRAVEKFDYLAGWKFSTGAVWKIRQAISLAIANQARTIRLPVHKVQQVSTLWRAWSSLSQDGREPTADELGRALDLTRHELDALRGHLRQPRSLDSPVIVNVGDGPEVVPFGWVIEDQDLSDPAEAVIKLCTLDECEHLLERLAQREADLLRMRYGLDDGVAKTLDHISRALHVSRERVRQIESASMEKLRRADWHRGSG